MTFDLFPMRVLNRPARMRPYWASVVVSRAAFEEHVDRSDSDPVSCLPCVSVHLDVRVACLARAGSLTSTSCRDRRNRCSLGCLYGAASMALPLWREVRLVCMTFVLVLICVCRPITVPFAPSFSALLLRRGEVLGNCPCHSHDSRSFPKSPITRAALSVDGNRSEREAWYGCVIAPLLASAAVGSPLRAARSGDCRSC